MSDDKTADLFEFEPIKGYPRLHWQGKRTFSSTQYYPAQLKEIHGTPTNGWMNKIFWGDNVQVMSHLLHKYRGEIKLIYIDPPFDSKADYKKRITVSGKTVDSNSMMFEEKQYSDLWANDEYLQFMYERLILMRELLSDEGIISLHCDWHKNHHLRGLLDEVFGSVNFLNEIIWVRSTNPKGSQHDSPRFSTYTDTIFIYSKTSKGRLFPDRIRKKLSKEELQKKYHRKDEFGRFYDGPIIRSSTMGDRPNLVYEYKKYTPPASGWRVSESTLIAIDKKGNLGWSSNGVPFRKLREDDDLGDPIGNFWNDISLINSQAVERIGYPTQKPEELISRIIQVGSEPGDLIFDCFMGSGTTQAAALKNGRRYLGADINLGAIQTTTTRLVMIGNEILHENPELALSNSNQYERYTGFEVCNVNNYDVFRNPVEAKSILLETLEIEPFSATNMYDGEKDGRMVKIMPVNRIATRADLNELITGFDRKIFDKRRDENPNKPVERILIVCMGHEPDLAAYLIQEVEYDLDVEIVDILRDKSNLEFKRDSEADVGLKSGELIVNAFFPMNLLQKLSIQKEDVKDWKELVESIMIDWNYDGAVLKPDVVDVPSKDVFVKGVYQKPIHTGKIRIKITDLLSESLEMDI